VVVSRALTRFLVLAAAITLSACDGRALVETLEFEGPFSDLHVLIEAGDVELVATDEPGIRVEIDFDYHGGSPPELEAFVDGELLRVWLSCGDGCYDLDGRAVVYAPPDVGGKVDTGSGNIRVEGSSGGLFLESGDGSILGLDLGSPRLAAVADRGRVALAYASCPTALDVDVGRGDIEIELPAGAYDIDAYSGKGSVELVSVSADPSSRVELHLVAHDGDVRVVGY